MATLADRPVILRTALIGPIAVAGLIIAVLRQLDVFVVFSLLLQVPYVVLLQFIASGLLGPAAFAGGLGLVGARDGAARSGASPGALLDRTGQCRPHRLHPAESGRQHRLHQHRAAHHAAAVLEGAGAISARE